MQAWPSGSLPPHEGDVCEVVCEEGSLLLINTALLLHCTEIPPHPLAITNPLIHPLVVAEGDADSKMCSHQHTHLSMSYAREFDIIDSREFDNIDHNNSHRQCPMTSPPKTTTTSVSCANTCALSANLSLSAHTLYHPHRSDSLAAYRGGEGGADMSQRFLNTPLYLHPYHPPHPPPQLAPPAHPSLPRPRPSPPRTVAPLCR